MCEFGIALSVIALGLAVALRISLPMLTTTTLVGLFAIFHGHAHGAEMPDASAFAYAAGFLLATALLHGVGIALGLAAGRLAEPAAGAPRRPRAARWRLRAARSCCARSDRAGLSSFLSGHHPRLLLLRMICI